MPRTYRFECETLVAAPLEDVFEFFSKAENLEKLTPPSLRFHVVSALPIEMRPGARIQYRLRLFGIPFKWESEITVWEPLVRFCDVQIKGPYKKWEHEHSFQRDGERTLMKDVVDYAVPGWSIAPLVHALFVRWQVKHIFAYRGKVIGEMFGGT
ncbi:MAG TPA: SRPBCC family protein [Fimbriimonadaceae bacterium]|jgi:hypothetical protein